MAMWQFSVETLVIILELVGHSTLLELLRAVEIISSILQMAKPNSDEMTFQRSFS